MDHWKPEKQPSFPNLKLAVVGHVEWVSFLSVEKLPKPGLIVHASKFLEEPAGGGAVVAVKLAQLLQQPVHFFTALGKDDLGKKSQKRLEELGLRLNVIWKDQPTRRAISMVDMDGERAITVIGQRLQPNAQDSLPWQELKKFDGVFVTATDSKGLKFCRAADVLVTTPRIGLKTLQDAKIELDALIGSRLDPDEQIQYQTINPTPRLIIRTEGSSGGEIWPSERYKAMTPDSKIVDAYGCGDSFAAGVTAALAAGWHRDQAIKLGAYCGAKCVTHFGPYK